MRKLSVTFTLVLTLIIIIESQEFFMQEYTKYSVESLFTQDISQEKINNRSLKNKEALINSIISGMLALICAITISLFFRRRTSEETIDEIERYTIFNEIIPALLKKIVVFCKANHTTFKRLFFICIISYFLLIAYLIRDIWWSWVNGIWTSLPLNIRDFLASTTSTAVGGMIVVIITGIAGQINKTKEDTEFNKILELANGGDAHAQNEIGFMYLHGNGVVKDFVEAEKWFRKSARNGDLNGQNNLGMICENYHRHDNKSLINVEEARQWYMKAQKQNNFYAMYNLGRIYEKGIGVDKNLKESYKWYIASSDQGYPPAHRRKGILKKILAKEKE